MTHHNALRKDGVVQEGIGAIVGEVLGCSLITTKSLLPCHEATCWIEANDTVLAVEVSQTVPCVAGDPELVVGLSKLVGVNVDGRRIAGSESVTLATDKVVVDGDNNNCSKSNDNNSNSSKNNNNNSNNNNNNSNNNNNNSSSFCI